jgi:hypothetical protein
MGYVDGVPVSATAIGATWGLVGGPLGVVGGTLVGGVIDITRLIFGAKKDIEALEKEFFKELKRRYHSAVFITALERMGPAMLYLIELGVKPNTPEFERLLVKKLSTEIGYKGDCAIDLFGPAPPGKPRPLVAQISRTGKVGRASPHFNLEHGTQWKEACKAYHLEALKAWAAEQASQIEFEKDLRKKKETAKRRNVTHLMVNGGMMLFVIGYTLRQKKKIPKETVE